MPSGGRSFARRFRALLPTALLVCGVLPATFATALGTPPPGETGKEISAGMPLTDALLELQKRGLPLVFSSRVVRPEMKVRSRPVLRDPRSILDEVLAPHGLGIEEGPGGSLVVVSRRLEGSRSRLFGTVRSRHALAPLSGVSVKVVERGLEAVTDAEGRFEIDGLPPGTYTVHARRPGFVIGERDGVVVPPGAGVDVPFVLQPAPLTGEMVVVHPSRISVLQEQPAAPVALDRDEILQLPRLGEDVFRALSLLPGTTSNDVSAQFHLRGGQRDEVLVLLDGQELYDAYHLKDFDNALSVVPASNLANLDLTTGAFPSSYGDRMGGILDLSTITPSRPRRFRLSLSVLSAQLEGSGTVGDRAGWLASVRRGTTDYAGRLFGQEAPAFWDFFGKVDYRLTSRQSARLSLLYSDDVLDFLKREGRDLRQFDTRYESSYLWLTHQAVLSERVFVDTGLAASRINRDRSGAEDEVEKRVDVRDGRDLDVTGGLQSWNVQAGDRHFLKAGVELRRFTARYDYASSRHFAPPFSTLGTGSREGDFAFDGFLRDDYLGAYLSDRFQAVDALTLELGLRYDRHTLTNDAVWSPRVNLAWDLGRSSVARFGWGHYYQSQRAYELAVQDADTRLYPAERSAHWVASFEHLFAREGSNPISAVRAEVYRVVVTDPRPRYENLFESLEVLPEGSLDRFRIEPQSGTSQGVEIFVRGRAGSRLDWWLDYAYARSEDEIGGRQVPRKIDQRQTFNVDLNYRLDRGWNVNLAWRFHTGWRVTRVLLEDRATEDGGTQTVPVLGPLYGDRLSDYHRLDVRVSRRWTRATGTLTAFLDVQNLYHRKNPAGFDLELDEAAGTIRQSPEFWPGFFASAGISWEF